VERGDGIIVQSWDTAAKTGVANDYSVCTTWLLKEGYSYLLDVWRGRVEYPDLKKRVAELYYEYGATYVLIEDASSGQMLIQDLRGANLFNIIPRSSKNDKRARVDGISGALESGKILLPEEAPWLAEYEHELLAFPGGRHDDQVDSSTQYILWAIERAGSSFFEADFAYHLMNIRGMY
jgi:predicted phage terminase large subunit-like protein